MTSRVLLVGDLRHRGSLLLPSSGPPHSDGRRKGARLTSQNKTNGPEVLRFRVELIRVSIRKGLQNGRSVEVRIVGDDQNTVIVLGKKKKKV